MGLLGRLQIVSRIDYAVTADMGVLKSAEKKRDLAFRPSAEHAARFIPVVLLCHYFLPFNISSTIPYSLASAAVIQKSLSPSAKTFSYGCPECSEMIL